MHGVPCYLLFRGGSSNAGCPHFACSHTVRILSSIITQSQSLKAPANRLQMQQMPLSWLMTKEHVNNNV